jgi:uncharacterized protein involved in exopolysaccharide biosynthesis
MSTEARTARDRLDRVLTICKRSTRFWLPAFVVIILGSLAAGGVAFTRPRIYKSEALILYREGIRSSDLGGPDVGGDPARKLGMKLKEMILSRTQLQHVIDQFKLYPAIVEDRGYVDAVDEMRNHIAFRVKDGDTFGLSFEGEDAKRVQEVTARLAETLINENSKNRAEQAEVTKEFLDAEKNRVESELKEKETNLAKFLSKHPEFAKETAQASGTGAAGTAIRAAAQKGSSKSSDPTLLALEREASRIQERLGVPTTSKKKKPTEDAGDPKLLAEKAAAEADLNSAQKDLSDKLGQFTEQHPDVRAAKVRVKTAQDRVKRANDALLAGAASKPKDPDDDEPIIDRGTLESELRKVTEEIAAYKKKKHENEAGAANTGTEAQRVVALETDWTRLNREVQEARERNQQLQTKQFNASMAESAAASGRNAQMVIVDPAYKPTHPAKPSRSVIAAVGVLVSIGLALALALGFALLDDRLYDRVDVERLELVPLLGVVPRGDKSARGKKRKKKGDLVV